MDSLDANLRIQGMQVHTQHEFVGTVVDRLSVCLSARFKILLSLINISRGYRMGDLVQTHTGSVSVKPYTISNWSRKYFPILSYSFLAWQGIVFEILHTFLLVLCNIIRIQVGHVFQLCFLHLTT